MMEKTRSEELKEIRRTSKDRVELFTRINQDDNQKNEEK